MSDQHAVVTDDAIRLYNDEDTLIFLNGQNKEGKYGIWADHENGLCPHEEVARYCEECATALADGDAIQRDNSDS